MFRSRPGPKWPWKEKIVWAKRTKKLQNGACKTAESKAKKSRRRRYGGRSGGSGKRPGCRDKRKLLEQNTNALRSPGRGEPNQIPHNLHIGIDRGESNSPPTNLRAHDTDCVESFVNGLAVVFMLVGSYLCDEKSSRSCCPWK